MDKENRFAVVMLALVLALVIYAVAEKFERCNAKGHEKCWKSNRKGVRIR